MYADFAKIILDPGMHITEAICLCCRRKQAEVDRLVAAEQEADKQLMDAAMRKDAQEQAADKQLKAERKAEQLNYRSGQLQYLQASLLLFTSTCSGITILLWATYSVECMYHLWSSCVAVEDLV